MKKFKTSLILFSIFIVIALYFIFLERPKEKREAEKKEREKKVFTLVGSNINEIILKSGNVFMSFKRTSDKEWDMTQPVLAEADRMTIDAIVSRLENLEVERVVEEFPDSYTIYGLDFPKYTIALKVKGYAEMLTLHLGNKSPVGYNNYARREGDTKVLLISGALESLISKPFTDFRKKRVMDFTLTELKKLSIKMDGEETEFEDIDGKWYFTKPKKVKASEEKIRSLVMGISDLTVSGFVSDTTSPDVSKYGLNKPEIVSVAELKDGRKYSLMLGKVNNVVYGKRIDRHNIFSFSPDVMQKFKVSFNDFRDKKIFSFYVWRVNSVSVEKLEPPAHSFKIVRDKENTNKWFIEKGQFKEEGDPDKIREILTKLSETEIKRFIADNVDISRYIVNPDARVVFDVEGFDKPLAVILENKKGEIWGSVESDNSVYELPSEVTKNLLDLEYAKKVT